MKKFTLPLSVIILSAAALFMNGCILDAFNEITQNLAIDRNFTIAGNTSGIAKQTQTFRLSDSEVYNNNADKVTKMRYKAAAFCVSENNVPALQGDIILTLKTQTGLVLFTKTMSGFKANEYLGVKAKNLDLTQAEIDAINAYLSNSNLFSTLTFVTDLEVRNVTPSNTNVLMKCFVSLAMEMTFEP